MERLKRLKRPGESVWFALSVALLLLLSFAAYLFTLAPSISWRHWGIDTGELATAAYRLAVPHPSGYPVYLLLGKGFTLLPWGDVAYRMNLMSAVFAAATVGAVALAVYLSTVATHLDRFARGVGALTGTAMLAFSPTFWSQAVITEVYTLHTFFLGTLLVLLSRWQYAGERRNAAWLLLAVVLVLGMSLGNHLTAVLAAPGAGVFLLLNEKRLEVLRATVWAIPAFLLSLTPYVILPLRSSQGAWPSLWDTSTLQLLWDHITGGPFKGLLFAFPAEIVLSRLSAAASFSVEQYGVPGMLLAMAGLWFMARRERPLVAFWLTTGGATLFFALNYPVFDSQVYLLPFYLLLAVVLGWGVAFLAPLLQAAMAPLFQGKDAGRLAKVVPLALFILPAFSFVQTRPNVDLSRDWEAYDFARESLEALPAGALLLSWGPEEIFALWYLQYSEGVRGDVMVVGAAWTRLPQYQWTLQRHYGEAVPPAGSSDYLERLIAMRAGRTPAYATQSAARSLPELHVERSGALFRVGPS